MRRSLPRVPGLLCLSISGLSLLSACTVYVPLQGAAPDIRRRGEVEAVGSWSLSNRFDAAATYSPLPHVLLRAAASSKNGGYPGRDSTYRLSSQYELGLGTYWPLGQDWLVGGLVSYGRAHAQARYIDDGDFRLFRRSNFVQHELDARYQLLSAQGYVSLQAAPRASFGLALRLAQLRLTELTERGQPAPLATFWQAEPMLFVRLRPAQAPELVQFQLALGTSASPGYNSRRLDDRADPLRQFRLGSSYISVSALLYPHVLWQRKTNRVTQP